MAALAADARAEDQTRVSPLINSKNKAKVHLKNVSSSEYFLIYSFPRSADTDNAFKADRAHVSGEHGREQDRLFEDAIALRDGAIWRSSSSSRPPAFWTRRASTAARKAREDLERQVKQEVRGRKVHKEKDRSRRRTARADEMLSSKTRPARTRAALEDGMKAMQARRGEARLSTSCPSAGEEKDADLMKDLGAASTPCLIKTRETQGGNRRESAARRGAEGTREGSSKCSGERGEGERAEAHHAGAKARKQAGEH